MKFYHRKIHLFVWSLFIVLLAGVLWAMIEINSMTEAVLDEDAPKLPKEMNFKGILEESKNTGS